MFRRLQHLSLMALVAMTVALLVALQVEAKKPKTGPSYTIIPLDNNWEGMTFPHGEADDVNEWREIVGSVEEPTTGTQLAAYWSTDNQLKPLRGNGKFARGINDLSEVVGLGYDADQEPTGLYWPDPASNPVPLSALAGDYSGAWAINNAGVICGVSRREVYGPDPENPDQEILLTRESHPVVWKVSSAGILGPFELPNLFDLGLTDDPNEAQGSPKRSARPTKTGRRWLLEPSSDRKEPPTRSRPFDGPSDSSPRPRGCQTWK